MEDLRNLLDKISPSQLLTHFRFQMVEHRQFYLIYSSASSPNTYYIFLDEQQITRVFAPRDFTVLDKTELFLELIDPESFEEVSSIIAQIQNLSVPDESVTLPRMEAFTFLTRLAALRKVTRSEFDLAETPQFQNKVFQTANGVLCIPLYAFRAGQEKSDRVMNFAHVKDRTVNFFNNSRDWLTTTCYDPENRFLLLTSDPSFWLKYLSSNYGPDYFMILCHPDPNEETFHSILSIMDRLAFPDLFLSISENENDKRFLANITTLFLNTFVENLVFKMNYEYGNYYVTVYSVEGCEHIEFMCQLVDEVNQRVRDTLSRDDKTNPRQASEIINALAVFGSSRQLAGKDVFTVAFSARTVVDKEFFFLLTKKFGIDNRLKVFGF